MSDSSWAPTDWVVAVREAWGDYCFFNSAIRSVKSRRTNLDEYHKLVTTMNPGMQRLPKVPPTTGLSGWVSVKRDIFKSMGTVGAAKPGDYLHPITLEQAGLKGYESVIKFYRERAVPTVRGRVRTDRPVVVTQMRFNGIAHACEFARRYKLNIEVLVPEHQWSKTGLPPGRIRDIVDVFGTPVYSDPKGSATRVRIWSNKGDRRNTSQHRGEASEYVWYDGFLRVADLSPYDADPYVCDRAHGGCKDCGLCATLDGTQQDWTNWLNVAPWGKVLLPITGPKGAYYTGAALGEGQGQFFNDILRGQTLDEGEFDRFLELSSYSLRSRYVRNENVDLDWVQWALESIAVYADKDTTILANFCEGWNTHENAKTLTALCVWQLMRAAKQQGLNKGEAFSWIEAFVADVTGSTDVLGGVENLPEMWTNQSPWTDQFGLIVD
jgi:hypothetical protein